MTHRRSTTSNHGRSRIVSRVSISSLVLSDITDDLCLILLTSRPPSGFNWQGHPVHMGTGLFDLILESAQFSNSVPILAFPTETGQYILDTDASNFGLGGVLSQITK